MGLGRSARVFLPHAVALQGPSAQGSCPGQDGIFSS